ncbi:MAG: acyltransferase family protein [Ruminococcus sp.]|nr:acyltransferase family protein [Ruminococcus sp.]
MGQYSNVNGIEYPAGVGVSLFLILSGYGLAMSYSKNGLAHYWTKKIQRVWIPYVFVQLVDMLILT